MVMIGVDPHKGSHTGFPSIRGGIDYEE
jgi:hypothetical protein